MNVDRILETLNAHRVDYLLIGGVNYLLRHGPILTYDVDVWIDDNPANLHRCEQALAALGAEWGPTFEDWQPVDRKSAGWLEGQSVFCLTSREGAIDVFRRVKGMESWAECRRRAFPGQTSGGVPYPGLADEDMLRCQLALSEAERNAERIRALRKALGQ